MKSLSNFITEALSKGSVTPKLRTFIDALGGDDHHIKGDMLAPASSKYNTLDDLVTYERKWNPNIKRGIDLNEDTPCMGVVNYDGNLYAVIKVEHQGVRPKIVYGDEALTYALFDLTKPMKRSSKGTDYDFGILLYNGEVRTGGKDPQHFSAGATLLIHNCTNDASDGTEEKLDKLRFSDLQLFSIQWKTREKYLSAGDDVATNDHLVYSLEDIKSVLLNRGKLHDEWEDWMQELKTKLTELADNGIGNTPKSLTARWKTFRTNIYRYNIDKYDRVRDLVTNKLNGMEVKNLAEEMDSVNSMFKYFLHELRILVKSKREVSANAKLSGKKNYLIELHELLQQPFTVKVDSEVDFEMESKTDTILKLAVVCCGDKKLIDEYISKFGNPLK